MSGKECIEQLSNVLFWDIDKEQADMDSCPEQIIQRVLEYGTLDDWRTILSYYGLDAIVTACKQMRTLDPIAFSFIRCISNTSKEEYRCYHTRLSNPLH